MKGMTTTYGRRRRWGWIRLLLLWSSISMLLLPLLLLLSSGTTTADATAASSGPSKRKSHSSASRIKPHASSSSLTVILYETEVYKDGEWSGHPQGRWRNTKEEACEAPSQIQPPSNYQWAGDWKIVTSTRDSLGWQYNMDSSIRKRTWLRSIIIGPVLTTKQVSVSTKKATTKTKSVGLSSLLAENWNFKGWGWSFYKSLLWRDSCGVSLRLPLSQNLDAWERHPGLPSITSSFELYYPWTIAFFLNMSINLDYLQHAMKQLHVIFSHYCRIMIETIWKPIYFIVSTLLFLPTTKQDIHNNGGGGGGGGHRVLTLSPPTYHMDISERIGCSISWRMSKARGYEFRLSYWHSYLPTILYLVSLLSPPFFLRTNVIVEPPGFASWLRNKIASLGISTSGPIPNEPHFSCSTFLSLSGFHYKRRRNNKSMDEITDNEESLLMTVEQQQEIQSAKNETDSISDNEDGIVETVAAATEQQQVAG